MHSYVHEREKGVQCGSEEFEHDLKTIYAQWG